MSGREDLAHLFFTAVVDFFLASCKIVSAVCGYPECGVIFVDGLTVATVAAHGFCSLVLGQGCEYIHQKHKMPEHMFARGRHQVPEPSMAGFFSSHSASERDT